MDETEAKNKISSRARGKRREIEGRLHDLLDEFNQDMHTALEKSKNEVVSIFTSRKNELVGKANESVKDYLDNLEKELKDKKAQIANYEKAIASINEIGGIL